MSGSWAQLAFMLGQMTLQESQLFISSDGNMTLGASYLAPSTLRMCVKSSQTDQQSIDPITGFTPPSFHPRTVIYTLIVAQADVELRL